VVTDLYVPAMVSLFTDMRLGEVLALRWSRVDLDKKIIQGREALEETKKHGIASSRPNQRPVGVKSPSPTFWSIRCAIIGKPSSNSVVEQRFCKPRKVVPPSLSFSRRGIGIKENMKVSATHQTTRLAGGLFATFYEY
jgi:hypothetical protein